MAVNDPKYRFLRGLGFDADLNTMEQDWLSTLVDNPSYEYNDLWFDYLRDQGYDGALQDMWKRFIGDQGYSDDYDFWEDVANGVIPFPGSEGITVGLDGDFLGYDGNVGDLNPKEFLDTGVDITRIGALGGGSDWSLNGDWAANGDWLLEEFELFVIGDGLPDVGDIEFTVDGETTVLTYNAGTYESDDLGASRIFELFAQNIGTTFPFSIEASQPVQDTITIGSFIDDGNSRYLGYISSEAAITGLPAFGDISNRDFFNEVNPVQLFFVVDGGQQGVFFISIFSTALDSNAESTPDVGNVNAIIDGTSWLLTRNETNPGTGIFQYAITNPVTGLPDIPTNQAFYNFLDAREGQTVPYALELAQPVGLTVEQNTLSADPTSSIYSQSPVTGSLNPPVLVDGNEIVEIKAEFREIFGVNRYAVSLRFDSVQNNVVEATFDGQTYTFTVTDSFGGDGRVKIINDQTLYNLLRDNQGTAITFSAVSV